MLTTIVDFLFGSLGDLTLFLLNLFPTVELATLPLWVPQSVSDVLSALNWFIPMADLLAIVGAWATLVLLLNTVLIFNSMVKSLK